MRTGKGTLFSKTIRGHQSASWPALDPRNGHFIYVLDVDEVGGSRSVRCVKDHLGGRPSNWKIEVEGVPVFGGKFVVTKCAVVEE